MHFYNGAVLKTGIYYLEFILKEIKFSLDANLKLNNKNNNQDEEDDEGYADVLRIKL